MKKLLLIGPYPPFYSYGGPTRSIKGLYNTFSSEKIKCKVLSPKSNLNSKKRVLKLENNNDIIYSDKPLIYLFINGYKFDVIWFNSFFELKLLFIILFSKIFKFKLIISPRGQLSKEAIKTSNGIIKNRFINTVKLFSKNLTFHATDIIEKKDISHFFKENVIFNIKNIFNLDIHTSNLIEPKFLFYSRIHKKKGLDILLDHLIISKINISLDIYGFIEDENYWDFCEKKIKKLKNVNYCGSILDGDISILKNKYSFFILPTLNENFGHVIIELISLGIIPVISKGTTPFEEIITSNIGLNFNLKSTNDFERVIKNILKLEKDQIMSLKQKLKDIFMILDSNQKKVKKDYINLVEQL